MNLRHLRAVFVFILTLSLSGCLFRSRKIEPLASTAPLQAANQAELLNYINTQAARIRSMQATVNIDTSVGGAKKGKITDYQEIRGIVLARKPAMLRMVGFMPIVRTTAFDMVSNGQIFKLWIPPKNRYIVGRDDVKTRDLNQPMESIRPQQIYDALLLPEIEPSPRELAVIVNETETVLDAKGHKIQQPDYVLEIIHNNNPAYLSRRIVFSRTDLLPDRQLIYNERGDLVTDVHYEGYKDYGGVNFPSQIEIWRPQEEYDITLNILKLELNQPLPDSKFTLNQPAGAQVVHLDQGPQSSEARGNPGTGN